MKTRNIFLILLFPFIASMTGRHYPDSLNGNWTLVCYSDLISRLTDCKSQNEQSLPISLVFLDDGKTGTINGHTSRNDVTGSYMLLDNHKIKVDKFGGTMVGEMTDWGDKIWTTIQQSSSYKYKSDTLVIQYDNDSKAMKFVKTEYKQKK